MICEKCAGEVEAVVCGFCGGNVVKLGPYCYACGHALSTVEEGEKKEQDDEFDLSSRILCSDEACIGVVNEQGICKVCGKPYEPGPQGNSSAA